MKFSNFFALMLLMAAIMWAPCVYAQSDRGTLTGTVKDQSGGVVPNAKVIATNIDSGEKRETTTGDEGSFTLPELKAAPYRLSVEAAGFKTVTIDNIQLGVQITRRAEVTLEAGDISENVTVSAEASVLQTDSPVQQLNVTERQVRELPLVVAAESGGRSPLAFIFLDSSVTPQGSGSSGTNATNFRINGSQGLGQDILIDGAGTRRAENGTFFSEVAPGPNAFQEFTINTSNYSAEFGNSSGGVINFTIKSGGNDFHGEAYLFLINEALNANTTLNRIRLQQELARPNPDPTRLDSFRRPIDRQRDYGFAIGGPVFLTRFGEGGPAFYNGRNKTFFFFNYGGYRTTQSETVDITVPTLRMRNGDFSELLTDPYVTQFFGGPVLIYNPDQTPGSRTALPGNIIPASLISNAGRNIANLFPLPNQTGPNGSSVFRNYLATSQATAQTDYYVTKINQVISEKQQVNVSYTFRKLPSTKGGFPRFPGDFVNGSVWDQQFKSYYARLQHDYTITPTMLNHINLGFNRTSVENFNFGRGVGRASALGIPVGSTQDLALPKIGFPNYGNEVTSADPRAYQPAGSTFFDNLTNDNAAEFTDFVSYSRGRHTFKFGGDVRRQQLNLDAHTHLGGEFNFMARQTANTNEFGQGWPIASLLTGRPEFSFNSLQAVQPAYEYLSAAGFIQDDVKITPSLTLNLGVRYDYSRPREERLDRYRGFSPTTPNPEAGGRLGAIIGAAGQGGLPSEYRGLVKPDRKNFGPRFGLAYSIDSRTVVRGGYGIYYSPVFYGNGGDALLGYSINDNTQINFDLNSGISLDRYPSLPVRNPNGQYISNLTPSIDYYDPNFKLGRTAQYDLSLQRELPYGFAASLSYIGNKGTRLRSSFNPLNSLPVEALRLGDALLRKKLVDVTASDRAYATSVGFTLPSGPDAVYPGFGGQTGSSLLERSVAQSLRPFPHYGNINNRLESQGQSFYNALKVELQRRFTDGIQFGASYTFSKLLTDAAEDLYGGSALTGILQNPADRRSLRSLSPGDVPHSFVVNYLVELPFGKGKRFLNQGGFVDRLVGGFQISGIQRYRSGTPIAIFIGGGRREFLDLLGIGGNVRPNLTGQPFFTDNLGGGSDFFRYFNRAAFALPTDFRGTTAAIGSAEYRAFYANPSVFLGTAAPTSNDLRTKPFFSEDLSILKKTRITETTAIEFRAEFFNLFNRSRPIAPGANFDAGNFGDSGFFADIFQPRRIQLGARFIF